MVAAARSEPHLPTQRIAYSFRRPIGRMIGSALISVCVAITSGCVHETQPPAMLRGEVTREHALYFVRECTTGRRYELKLNAHAEVLLERHVGEARREAPGPVLVELGGKILPATTSTKADAIFDVHSQYAVRPGACE